jgi:hypothetical protein
VGEHEIAKDGGHERVGAAFIQEFVDPKLKAAVQREFGAEDFVLGEDQEEGADTDAEEGQGAEVGALRTQRKRGLGDLSRRCS